MYLAHFGLNEFPFGLTPDTGYFFPGAGSQGALNTLLVALEAGEGLIKIVGEVGSGKTLLCRHLLNRLESEGWATAYIPNPNLSPAALNQALLAELGGDMKRGLNYGLTKALENRLLELAQSGRRAVALIDEAQAIPLESLEALRLVTNLETEKRKLLQIVLFGQPELDAHLADPSVRQIKSRIAFHDRITPLTRLETPVYLAHRARQAGAASALFSPISTHALHRASSGLPRLLNILAHKSLLVAYGEGAACVTPRHVRLALRDTPGARESLLARTLGRLSDWLRPAT
jgi:MSHA biogenesis protein MshM